MSFSASQLLTANPLLSRWECSRNFLFKQKRISVCNFKIKATQLSNKISWAVPHSRPHLLQTLSGVSSCHKLYHRPTWQIHEEDKDQATNFSRPHEPSQNRDDFFFSFCSISSKPECFPGWSKQLSKSAQAFHSKRQPHSDLLSLESVVVNTRIFSTLVGSLRHYKDGWDGSLVRHLQPGLRTRVWSRPTVCWKERLDNSHTLSSGGVAVPHKRAAAHSHTSK